MIKLMLQMRNLCKRVWKLHKVTQLVNRTQVVLIRRHVLHNCGTHPFHRRSSRALAAPSLYRRGALAPIPPEGGIPGGLSEGCLYCEDWLKGVSFPKAPVGTAPARLGTH